MPTITSHLPPALCACVHACVPNPATLLHLDVSICSCQPSLGGFFTTNWPQGGVLSMCPPHPLFIFSTFMCMHTPSLPIWPQSMACAPPCMPWVPTTHPFPHQSHRNKPCLTGMHPQTPHQTSLGSMPICAPFHAPPLPHTSVHLVHYFFLGFSYTHFTFPCPGTLTSLSHGPWVGKFFLLGKTLTVVPGGL